MDILYEPICPLITPCKYPADIIPFFSKSCCLHCYMKRANFPYFSSTDNKKMPVKDLFLSAIFQVVFDKLFSGLIFVFAHWDRIHVKLKNWSQRLSSIQAQIKDDAGETQWLRSAIDLAGEVTNLLDEMASFPGSEDLKETTRKILAYECLPSIGSTYGTQEEEDNIKLPRTYRGKSSKWKKKYRPRKLYQRKSIKWKKKHPPKHKKKVRTINKSVGVSSSTATKENHDQLIYSLVNPLASRIAALMSQRKTDYCREIYQEKTPPQTHEHIHEEQSSSLHKGEGMKKSVELNIQPTTSATLDSTLGKVTELQTCMERRFVELEKMLRRVLSCIEKRDASPICAQNRKRQRAPKLPPAKRRKTKGPEVAKHPSPPGSNVPSTPVVDATSNTPTLFFCSFVL
ncbi:uncharacterized protein LOC142526366 [Primulina tabacum]|uniref:uncharacterized protein LOC142526366 n=1 Tax=Primulina tabacum TaxID=48773 RepID=UPI003F5A6FBF